MKCPCCLELMSCQSEVHHIDKNKYRMDLHCWNNNCLTRTQRNITNYGSFIQVIINDPSPWKANKYGLVFKLGESFVILEGSKDQNYTKSIIISNKKLITLKSVDFIDISTSDDMHIDAGLAIKQLTKLIAFFKFFKELS